MQLKQLFGNQSNANNNNNKTEQKQEKKELTDSFVHIEEPKPNLVDLENDFVSIEESILSLPGVNIISEKEEVFTATSAQGTIDGLYQDQHYEIPRNILPKESKIDSYTQSVLDVNSKPYASPIEGNPHVIVQEAKSNIGAPTRGIGHVLALTDDQKDYGIQKNVQEEPFKLKYDKPYSSSQEGLGYASSFSTNVPYGFAY